MEDSVSVTLKEEHQKLKDELTEAASHQSYWESRLGEDRFKKVIKQFGDTIQSCRVQLEDAKNEDVKRLQADIASRKDILTFFERQKSTTPIVEARRRLTEFEAHNALLLREE